MYYGFDTKQGVTPARHDKCFMQNHVFFEPRNHIPFLGYAVLNTSQMARYFFLGQTVNLFYISTKFPPIVPGAFGEFLSKAAEELNAEGLLDEFDQKLRRLLESTISSREKC